MTRKGNKHGGKPQKGIKREARNMRNRRYMKMNSNEMKKHTVPVGRTKEVEINSIRPKMKRN
jgi:predicted AAA+ superfamily ATPase